MYAFQWTIFYNFDFLSIIANYYDVAKPQLYCVWIHMDVLNGEMFSFFQNIKVWWY